MPRRALADPYLAVLRRFNQRNVGYVVIGMAGINFYADSPATSFGTMDYDCFVEPTLANVERAVAALRSLDFTLATREGVVPAGSLREVVRARRTLIATTVDGVMVELLLQISGYTFAEMADEAKIFTVQGVPVKVGQLQQLLQSKRAAGRPKDQQFLERYEAQLAEAVEPRAAPRAARPAKRRRQ